LKLALAVVLTICASAAFAQNAEFGALLNALRSENGKGAVQQSETLRVLAENQARHMEATGALSHAGPKGRSVGKRARKAGYKWCHIAENVAQGQRDAQSVLRAWSGSKPHRKNMLLRKVKDFGMHQTPGGFSVLILAQPGC
jgi:uncharacterized protein YkwD